VIVSEPSRVNHSPAFAGLQHAAVVSQEANAAALKVQFGRVQGQIERIGRCVVVRCQMVLLAWSVSNYEVERRLWWLYKFKIH
jgi:hypothetical protein